MIAPQSAAGQAGLCRLLRCACTHQRAHLHDHACARTDKCTNLRCSRKMSAENDSRMTETRARMRILARTHNAADGRSDHRISLDDSAVATPNISLTVRSKKAAVSSAGDQCTDRPWDPAVRSAPTRMGARMRGCVRVDIQIDGEGPREKDGRRDERDVQQLRVV